MTIPDPPHAPAKPAMGRTMAYKFHHNIMLLAHNDQAPSDAEWDDYLAQLSARSTEISGILVFTEGGGPTGGQRRSLKLTSGRSGLMDVRTSVVSTDRLTRGIVIALALFAPNLRAFKPEALDDALAYIQVHGPAKQAIVAEVEGLRQQLAR